MIILGAYKNIRQTVREEFKARGETYKNHIIEWNALPTVTRIQRPTNLYKAKTLGYKAKDGVVLARVRIKKGRRKRARPDGGRKPAKSGSFFSRGKSLRAIAEEKAARKFLNCEVLNSYYAGETGDRRYYEIILLDRNSPRINSDKFFSKIIRQKGRAQRGLSIAGRKYRGLEG